MRSCLGQTLAVLTVLLAGLSGGKAQGAELDSVVGRWVLDIDYVHELWKAEKGTSYSEAEWTKIRNDPGQIDTDEVRLDPTTISFYFRGKLNVAYPVLGWREEKGVIWVDYRHFLGRQMTTGFVRTGERLKLIHADGFWWLYQGYRRPGGGK